MSSKADDELDPVGRKILANLVPTRTSGLTALLTVIAVIVALGLSALLILSTGGSPVSSLNALYTGSVASQNSWTTTLLYAAPLLIVAVGACISARSGAFNIGQEGQVLIGALAAVWVSLRLSLPGPLLAVLSVLAAALFGGAWAGLSAVMHRLRGVNVVVSTLLMTFVAEQIVTYAVNQQWFLQQSQIGSATPNPQSNQIPGSHRLASWGQYPDLSVNVSLVIALVLALVVAFALVRTRWGFRLKMLGLNPLTAKHAGVRVAALGGLALALSGAFAGAAGAVIVTTPIANYRLQDGVSSNIGWDGLLVALVARTNPIFAVPVALLFGMLRAGGNFLASTGVPSFLVDVVKSLLVIAFVAPAAVSEALAQRRQRTKATTVAQSPRPLVTEGAAA
jgi:ABC-type uncharacterized transport system permease subunit